MPIGWVAAAGAVGALGGSLIQSGAQSSAADKQQDMFNTVTANSQPFMQNGYGASNTLAQLMGTSGTPGSTVGGTGLQNGYLNQTFNPTQDQLNNYPGYQFALQTGGQALTNSQTPSAGALSGSTLKNLMNFNQQTANSNYSNYFNQFQTQQNNIFNRLNSVAGLGQSAAAGVGNSGTQLAGNQGQALAAAGSSLGSGVSNAVSSAGTGAYLSSIMGGGSGSTGSSGVPLSGFGATSDPTEGMVYSGVGS